MKYVQKGLVIFAMWVVGCMLAWAFVEVAVCDPVGEEYTGAKRISVFPDKAPLFEQEVEVSSMCKFTGIQKSYKWIQKGGV